MKLLERLSAWAGANPLAAAVTAGAIVRMVAATVAVGFHARDDYFHVLEPALRWITEPAFDWDRSDVPGAGIRSHLVPRVVSLLLRALFALGVSEPASILRALYGVLGAYSLLVIPATAFSAGRLLPPRAATYAVWLSALFFPMPYAGTRLLIEALAMPPLVLAVGLCASHRGRDLLLAGLAAGVACWFRFQVGAAVLGLGVALALEARRRGGAPAIGFALGLFAAGAVAAFALQGLYDLWTTGAFLGPLLNNLAYNLCAASPGGAACSWVEARGIAVNRGLTESGVLTYLGTFLLLTAPPASVVIVPAMLRAARRLPLVSWPFAVFVAAHSLVPHKEERFMLPALPLFLLLVAAVPAEIETALGRPWEALRRFWPAARAWFIAVGAVALALAVTSQSQKNQRDAMEALRADPRASGAVSLGPEMPAFFAGPRLSLLQRSSPDPAWVNGVLARAQEHGLVINRFLGFAADQAAIEIILAAEGLSCEAPLVFDGWWLDRLIFRLNARHNRRRSPILLWRCEVPALARLGGPT